jgi:N6-L-threonylcarbamoyladenine synthase
MKNKIILAIESSCDETSAAVLFGSEVRSNIVSSQYFHSKFGGVVPELASRAHLQAISAIVEESLDKAGITMQDISAVAVTNQPGLVGSLIVGTNFAKGLALRYGLPIVPINHIDGHIYSGCLQDDSVRFPFIALVVSGGHTVIFHVESYNEYRVLGMTRDDAAGEAFDKIATLIGLGYPGGPMIDKLAQSGNPKRYDFPRSMIGSGNYEFSFSGLKTSVKYFLAKEFPNGVPEEAMPDVCASVQGAIVDVLVAKTVTAAREHKVSHIVVGGGVSANSKLREQMKSKAAKHNISVIVPEMSYCVDNAAMIGYVAQKKLSESELYDFSDLTFRVNANTIRKKLKASHD